MACRILYDEARGEFKYRINTTDIKSMKRLKQKGEIVANSKEYMPANYILLEKTLKELSKYPHNKTFTDIGCGKGRALFVAADFGFEKITGIEFFQPYCQQLEKDFGLQKHTHPSTSFSVTCGDAAEYKVPDHVQTIFFNNPFSEKVMAKVVKHITQSLNRTKRILYVIYISPVDKQLFLSAGFEEIYSVKRFNYIDASLLRYTG